MPRVRPLIPEKRVEYELKRISEKVIAESAVLRIKQKELAELQGITSSAISRQFMNKRITIETYIAFQILKEQK